MPNTLFKETIVEALKKYIPIVIITLTVTVITWFIGLQNYIVEKETNISQRLEIAREKTIELQQKNIVSELRIVDLESRLRLAEFQLQSEGKLTKYSFISSFLESTGKIAWCKEYNPTSDQLEMFFITPEYEQKYNVTLERYMGSTDVQIYGPNLAEIYGNHDLYVLENKAPFSFIEPVEYTNEDKNMVNAFILSWKFYYRTLFGDEFVCGFELSEFNEEEDITYYLEHLATESIQMATDQL